MTPLEDDVRERFASIAAPDVAAPTTSLLRRRAQRIRTTRIVAAVASIAVVAAGIGIGATSLLTRPQHAEFAAGVTAIPAHVDGVPPGTKQWQVTSENVAGRQRIATSWLHGSQPCISYEGGGWCAAKGELSEVADVGTTTGDVVNVAGSVPVSARVVVVHLGSETHTVQAVLTPTSSQRRFFATFFPTNVGSGPNTPLVGVLDATGRPVPAAVPAPPIPVANTPSHVQSLPAGQWSYATVDGGFTAIAYRRSDGSACVYATNLPAGLAHQGPICASAAPTATRVLLSVRLESGWSVLLGDAPTWVAGVLEWGSGGESSAGTERTPAASDRVFWAMSVPPGDGRLASCAAGDNCVTVVSLTFG